MGEVADECEYTVEPVTVNGVKKWQWKVLVNGEPVRSGFSLNEAAAITRGKKELAAVRRERGLEPPDISL